MRKAALFISFVLAFAVAPILSAQALTPISLPKPKTQGGKPLMQALAERKTSREFSPEKLSPQMLSNLLWAAAGINRPDGRRTSPSAMNSQEIDIFVALPAGVYVYSAKTHSLQPVAAGDLRAVTGTQSFVREAAVNLVYVADLARSGGSDGDGLFYPAADTGFIAQNVYLFCASEGLGTVVRGGIDRAALAKVFKLRPDQRVTLAQSVGYTKK